jgi:hypothetical protein
MLAVQDMSRLGTMAASLTCFAKPTGQAEFAPVQAMRLDLVGQVAWRLHVHTPITIWCTHSADNMTQQAPHNGIQAPHMEGRPLFIKYGNGGSLFPMIHLFCIK